VSASCVENSIVSSGAGNDYVYGNSYMTVDTGNSNDEVGASAHLKREAPPHGHVRPLVAISSDKAASNAVLEPSGKHVRFGPEP